MADVAPIDDKLAKRIADIIRMFVTDKEGDAVAATQALGRVLQSVGPDVIYSVAERIEHPAVLGEEDMQKILDTGIAIGIKQAEQKTRSNGGSPNFPRAYDMALYCQQHIDRLLRDKDREFIENMVTVARYRTLSPKRQAYLEDLYLKLGGRM